MRVAQTRVCPQPKQVLIPKWCTWLGDDAKSGVRCPTKRPLLRTLPVFQVSGEEGSENWASGRGTKIHGQQRPGEKGPKGLWDRRTRGHTGCREQQPKAV